VHIFNLKLNTSICHAHSNDPPNMCYTLTA